MKAITFEIVLTVCLVFLQFASSVTLAGGGSMDGGGGSGRQTARIKPESVQRIYEDRKSLLFIFLNRDLNERIPDALTEDDLSQALADKIYSPDLKNSKIHALLQNLKIEFRLSDTCLDKYTKREDGSIANVAAGYDICISSANLARRYSARDVTEQILGLVLHEVSHLSNANEDEATEIQDQFIAQYEQLKKDQGSIQYVYSWTIGHLDQPKFNATLSKGLQSTYGEWLCGLYKMSAFQHFKGYTMGEAATNFNMLPRYMTEQIAAANPVSPKALQDIKSYCYVQTPMATIGTYQQSLPIIKLNRALAAQIKQMILIKENK